MVMKRVGFLLGLTVLLGCGGAGSTLLNLLPFITGLRQSSASAGGGPFQLGVTGTNFAPGAKVLFNGQQRNTTMLDPGEVQAEILAEDIATPGTYPIVVVNPDGMPSDPVNFTVNP